MFSLHDTAFYQIYKMFGLYPGLNPDRLRTRYTPSQLSYLGILKRKCDFNNVKECLHVAQSNHMAIMVPVSLFLVCTVFFTIYQPAEFPYLYF